MKKISFLLVFISILSCNKSKYLEKKNLYGEWGKPIVSELEKSDNIRVGNFIPYGFKINKSEFERFYGYHKYSYDTILRKGKSEYFGNSIPYKLIKDSLFVLKPTESKWKLLWVINKITEDTLYVKLKDSLIRKYIKLKNIQTNDFDQIIYSSSGCYGSCPIIDISIEKNGNTIFQGENYVNQLGFFTKQIDSNNTKYIFNKFNKINIGKLKNRYAVSHTDDQTITTTFIKNGKIIKSVSDYGSVAPRELFWSYDRIGNLHKLVKFDSLKGDLPYYSKLNYYSFKKGKSILRLEKSESFYLWTELQKGKRTEKLFKPEYKMSFRGNYSFWSNDINKLTEKPKEIKEIQTNGRYFKFIFKKSPSETFDLGYDFVKRNFNKTDFK
jgi:hypothetical protein